MGLDVTKKILLDGERAAASALRSLAGVVNDLWGASEEPAAPAASSEKQAAPVTDAEPTAPAQAASAAVEKTYKPAFPPFEQLWKVADETVDWTEALVREHPADGLTSEHLWGYFHSRAAQVLKGDMDAYLDVLKAANPLGDLSPYARAFEVGAEDADTLCASFDAEPAYMTADTAEQHRYLAGVALRVARDLMALLPVRSVKVYAQQHGENLLVVTYPRTQLQKVRFGFVDPVALTLQCGGQFVGNDVGNEEAGG